MGRKPRDISGGRVLIKQNGDFCKNNYEANIYKNKLFEIAERQNVDIYGYYIGKSNIMLYIHSEDIAKFMQILNSSFTRERNKNRENKDKNGKIDRYVVTSVGDNEKDDIAKFIEQNGGIIFVKSSKNISIEKKHSINNIKKRKNMNIVALNSETHKNLRYTGGKIPNTTIAKITVSEMKKCAENFCIVFTNDVVPTMVVLLGQTENVIIDDEFSGYIPASLKNYPFLLGNADGKRVLCVDMDSDHLSENDKGERLFGDDENKSEFLDKVIVALKNYDSDFKRTQLMMEELKKSGILINKELNLKVADENYVLIKGFSVVSRSKLNELDDKTLAMFVRNGYMDLINIHLSSLSNFQTLASRILEK
ncbi:SapC family protein [Campylobacter sp. RM16190]|uniref:SapC family protein n=1 Tax=Campylobacter sp. RM16190 TaxID=1705727 RepID=UPI0014765D89|nr:SapC family protein [Campylobacter sp. RM16190]